MNRSTTGTLGERRIRTSFNPSEINDIDRHKQHIADEIDFLAGIDHVDGEQARLKSLAMTALEEASMWAVKAMTYNK